MANYNAENERISGRYFGWLKEAKQCSEATVDLKPGCAAAHIGPRIDL
jgi:hypothetical protein